MSVPRTHYSAEKKVEILREHLENQVSMSELSRRYHIKASILHRWKKELFEGALDTFSKRHQKHDSNQSYKMQQLEDKVKDKDSLIVEILSDNIRLKKKLNGDI